MPNTTSTQLEQFVKTIWTYYRAHRRSFPWRENLDTITEEDRLYCIIVSEIMLQQTQAPRVVPKYESFLKKFSTFEVLAKAPLRDVLLEWQGLGYNRRGMYLKQIAEAISTHSTVRKNNNLLSRHVPHTAEDLSALPGIGPNTAGSILAFAYNIPHPFIETNIRSVFIHFFFPHTSRKIHDREILELVARALSMPKNKKNPREWYYALMDYGTMLKSTLRADPAHKSKIYKKQSTFKGSNRELRAKILRSLVKTPKSSRQLIKEFTSKSLDKNLNDLKKEGLIKRGSNKWLIS